MIKPKTSKPKSKRVIFKVIAEPGNKVCLAGSFNNWDPAGKEMTDPKGTGVFAVTLTLAPGTYEYKFVINGTWCVDPECAEWAQNSLGTLFSVRKVE